MYADGGIVREGPEGDQGAGTYSAGRGGAGNIDYDPNDPNRPYTGDDDVVPETATRIAKEESHHVGRGGAGNEAHVHKKKEKETVNQYGYEKEVPKESLMEKIKDVFHRKKDN